MKFLHMFWIRMAATCSESTGRHTHTPPIDLLEVKEGNYTKLHVESFPFFAVSLSDSDVHPVLEPARTTTV